MSKVCPLFSGSTGNCTYIGTKNGSLLVDAGVSMKRISEAVSSIGGSLEEIKAVLITHDHSDHIVGLKPLLNKLKVPVIASEKTMESLIKAEKIPSGIDLIPISDELTVSGIAVKRFSTSHDSVGSSGYSFILPDGKKVAICTDLGIVTDEVKFALNGSDLVLIEANHDIEMLKKGPYPPYLKTRILSEKGHISNNACAAQLSELLKNGTKRFILCHLSQHNNTPVLARSCAEAALMDIGAENGKDYLLNVAKPFGNGVTVI